MHDIKLFVEQTDAVKKNLAKRNLDGSQVDRAISLNNKRKELTTAVETRRAEVKNLSREVGELKKTGKDASGPMSKVAEIKAQIEGMEKEQESVQEELKYLLSTIPNLVDDAVPPGKDETSNVELKTWGQKKTFSFKPKEHTDIGEALGLLDFDRAAKITGSRFVVTKGDLARLERALINFMLDQHIANGYQEILPPFIVNDSTLYGTGQLPKFKEDLFKLEGREWYLIPTAEVPVTNLKRDELFPKEELPLKYAAYTPCFRSEAGSYGKDTKGMIRQHQFNKIELVNIVAAEDSVRAHEDMVNRACSILELLKLPYRQLLLCGGDIGFGARKCIDIEVWLPGQNTYREISSVSNCWDFQARRAQIRYRGADGKPEFAHTLNGSGLAVGRTLIAILENYQEADGSVTIPEVLRPYMGGKTAITKK